MMLGRISEYRASRPAGLATSIQLMVLFVGTFLARSTAQQGPQGAPSPRMGVSTGAARPAVKDPQSRPITAGGFVDNAPIVFSEMMKQAGLDKFRHRSGSPKKESIIETL